MVHGNDLVFCFVHNHGTLTVFEFELLVHVPMSCFDWWLLCLLLVLGKPLFLLKLNTVFSYNVAHSSGLLHSLDCGPEYPNWYQAWKGLIFVIFTLALLLGNEGSWWWCQCVGVGDTSLHSSSTNLAWLPAITVGLGAYKCVVYVDIFWKCGRIADWVWTCSSGEKGLGKQDSQNGCNTVGMASSLGNKARVRLAGKLKEEKK